MSSLDNMNRPDFEENDMHQSPEILQRWQAAITTIVLLLIVSYGWQHLSYQTTIQRTLHEIVAPLIPPRFLKLVRKSVAGVASLPDTAFTGLDDNIDNKSQVLRQTHEGYGLSSVVERARSLSGFGTKTMETTFAGLGNWDNSCFQNSVLQGLASLQVFKAFIEKSLDYSKAAGIGAPTLEGLEMFLNQLQQELSSRDTIWPPSVLRSMNTWQQQDAQEYFSKIMDAIEKESRKYQNAMTKRLAPGLDCLRSDSLQKIQTVDDQTKSESGRLVASLLPQNPLDGSLSQILRCQKCGFSEGISLMSFNCLTLNLGLGGNCDLEQLLDAYTDPELIEGVECDECTRLGQAKLESGTSTTEGQLDETSPCEHIQAPTKIPKVLSTKAKRILFGRLPQDLVIHINRSIFDDWGNQRKNTSFVYFPPTLEIVGDWMTSLGGEDIDVQAVYELRCIVTHQGRHDNGHYVACGKRGKQWHSFNDEIVTRITEEQVLGRGHVFMLFYELIDRRTIFEITPPDSPSSSDGSSESPAREVRQRQSAESNGAKEIVAISTLNQHESSDVTNLDLSDAAAVYNSESDQKLSASLTS